MTEKAEAKIEIPGYTLKGELGRGGMATVYLAIQDSLDREVAIKVMAPALGADPTFAARFRREARTIARLSHPNVIPIYDIGVTGEHYYYFSMQYLSGGDLKSRIGNKFSDKDIVAIIRGITQALAFAHSHGFAHRDVKPENILFDAAGTPMLTDFGIARAIASDTHLTGTGVSVGTTRYMSPEQAKGGEIDERTDIYSVGVVLWEILTGKAVYEADDGFAMAYAHVHEPIPRLPDKYAKWQPVIDKALAKEPNERYNDANELYAACESATGVQGVAGPATTVSKPASPLMDIGGVLSNAAGAVDDAFATGSKWVDQQLVPKLPDAIGKPLKGNRLLQGGIVLLPLLVILAIVMFGGGDEQSRPVEVVTTDETVGLLGDQEGVDALDAGAIGFDAEGDMAVVGDEEGEVVSADEAETHIGELLSAAAGDLAADRLTTPPGSNALERYRAVLELDPGNAGAQAGLERIVARYVDLVEGEIANKNAAGAMRYVDRARAIVPDDPRIAEVVERIEPMKEAAYMELIQRGQALVGSADREGAVAAFRAALTIRPGGELALAGLAQAEALAGSGDTFSDAMTSGGQGPDMIMVDRGFFTMGGDGGVPVSITKPFALAQREVTVGEFRRFLDESGWYGRKGHGRTCMTYAGRWREMRGIRWEDPQFAQTEQNPVVCITWHDAGAYAEWMSAETGQAYRLPTEAEWEYAAASGFLEINIASDPCTWGNVGDEFFHIQYPREKSVDCSDGSLYTAQVSGFSPNSLGLQDMVGNVREWIQDCWNRDHEGRPSDQSARTDGDCRQKVMKGSSWISGPGTDFIRTRVGEPPDRAFNTIGFRLARNVD